MKNNSYTSKSTIIVLLISLSAVQVMTQNYTYQGKDWTGTCATGMSQSPIDLPLSKSDIMYSRNAKNLVESKNIRFLASYNKSINATVYDYNQTVRVNTTTGYLNSWDQNGAQTLYNVKGFTFHQPSEHTLNGQKYDLELQIAHTLPNTNNTVLVISIFFDVENGGNHTNDFISSLALTTSRLNNTAPEILLMNLIREVTINSNFYQYSGSLTIPTCTEGITYNVIQTPQHISTAQLQLISSKLQGNSRTVQPLNNRKIYYFDSNTVQMFSYGMNQFYSSLAVLISSIAFFALF